MRQKSVSTGKTQIWRFVTIIMIIAGVVFTLAMIGLRLLTNDRSPIALGDRPQSFMLMAFSGESIDITDLQGKVVLINFWASWCTTCDDEAELLETAWIHYQATSPDEVVFLGVAYMDAEPASRAFLSEYGITYPNGPDLRGEISKKFQVTNVPETYLLDKDGVLHAIKIGSFLSLEQIYDMVDRALAQ